MAALRAAANAGLSMLPAPLWRRVPPQPALAAAAVLITVGLGLYRLSAQSVWLDEAASFFLARLGWLQLGDMLAESKGNMSLYFVALKLWAPVGDSESAFRSLSVLFAVLTIPAAYVVGARLLASRWLAAMAALLLATNAMFIEYAQEARGYTLAMLLACVSTYAFLRAEGLNRRRDWAAYGVAAAAVMYAHIFGAFIILAHLLARLILWRTADWRTMLPGLAVGLLLMAPLAAFVLFNARGTLSWLDAPTLLLVAAGSWFVARRDSVSPSAVALLAAWALAPLVLSFLVSFAKPIFLSRYLTISLPALAILAAAGLGALRRPGFVAAGLVLVLAVNLTGVLAYYGEYVGRESAQASGVLRNAQPGDAVLFVPQSRQRSFAYYVRRLDAIDTAPQPLAPRISWTSNPFAPRTAAETAQRFEPCDHPRVWVVGDPSKAAGKETSIVARISAAYVRSDPGSNIPGVTFFVRRPDIICAL
jgi:mannosyltransferase